MARLSAGYRPLPDDCDFQALPKSRYDQQSDQQRTPSPSSSRLLKITAVFESIVIVVLLYLWYHNSSDPPEFAKASPSCPREQLLYSPLQDLMEYKIMKFNGGFGPNSSIYQGPPSDAVDAAWDALYQFGISKIPKSEAERLVNKTYPILGEDDQYIVEIDVFHELHCLNQIRKAMNPAYYHPAGSSQVTEILLGEHHLSHCLDSIRQSLMCSADISTIVWKWDEENQMARSKFDIVHSCRNFDKIRDWAMEHHIQYSPDLSVHLEDDIVIPEF